MKKNLAGLGGFALVVSLATNLYAAAFTPGDLVVYRVGDGSTALTAATAPVFLDEYTTSGTLVQSIAMPTTAAGAQLPLTAAGNATSEGLLSLSGDGQYVVLGGYGAVVNTASIAASVPGTVPRVAGRVDLSGNIDTSTAFNDLTGNIRGVASANGSAFYATSSSVGLRYTTLGATGASTQITPTVTNTRGVNIFNGQLMLSDQSGSAVRISTVGSGLPTTSGNVATPLPGTTGASPTGPYAFTMLTLGAGPAPDTMYVANDLGNDIEKWTLSSGTWSQTGSISVVAPRGITATVVGGNVQIFATAGNSTTITNLLAITDASGLGGALTATPTIIAMDGVNEQYRGLTIIPVPEPSTIMLVGAGVLGMFAIRRRRS